MTEGAEYCASDWTGAIKPITNHELCQTTLNELKARSTVRQTGLEQSKLNDRTGQGQPLCLQGTVRVFRQKVTLEDAIGSHAFAPLEVSRACDQ